MINGIGKSGAGRIDAQRTSVGQSAAAQQVGAVASGSRSSEAGGVLADLLSGGAPVDTDKVSAIRQAIAEGRYQVDPDQIAERMIAADLKP